MPFGDCRGPFGDCESYTPDLSRVLKLSAVNLLGNICGKSYGAMSLQENMLLLRHVTFPFQAK